MKSFAFKALCGLKRERRRNCQRWITCQGRPPQVFVHIEESEAVLSLLSLFSAKSGESARGASVLRLIEITQFNRDRGVSHFARETNNAQGSESLGVLTGHKIIWQPSPKRRGDGPARSSCSSCLEPRQSNLVRERWLVRGFHRSHKNQPRHGYVAAAWRFAVATS